MPGDVLVSMILLGVVAAYVGSYMIKYTPGEKRAIEVERRARVHTRSHHYKLGER